MAGDRAQARRILVVDDDPTVLKVFTWMLESGGWSVGVATTCRGAVDEARTGGYDAVLLDLILPDCREFEAVSAIGKLTRAPIIVVSGRAVDRLAEARIAGAVACIGKPVRAGQLLAILDRVVPRPGGA